MGFGRFLRKTLLSGNIVTGHIVDAKLKKALTGRSFTECLKESVKETFTEDAPGLSHLYQAGKTEGRVQGTIEQAHRDERKMNQLRAEHNADRRRWKEIDNEKDQLIDELGSQLK